MKLKNITPPGYDLRQEKMVFFGGMAVSLIYAVVSFGSRLSLEVSTLYYIKGGQKYLAEDAVMPSFRYILDNSLLLFIVLFFVLLFYGFVHCEYHKMGSKSIYLMKRLPDKNEYMRRCWTLPVVNAAITLLVLLITLGVFYLNYYLKTPDGLIPLF